MWEACHGALPRFFQIPQTLLKTFTDNAELDDALVPKRAFLDALQDALARRHGFAAAKLGATEQSMLQYVMERERNATRTKMHMLELLLKKTTIAYSGIFPAESEFHFKYGKFFIHCVRELDVVGLFRGKHADLEWMLVNYFQLENPLTPFQNLHPDRSIPDDPTNCYLPWLRGKKILLISPFGNLLASRATREIFEGVWRASGKKFFEPARVEGLEFPYGFARETRARYATVLDLMREIEDEIAKRDFDVALIGAGGMGVPLAAFVKRLGKIGILLGGQLQLIFGVKGARWKNDRTWRDTFFNEWWIDMPAHYHPQQGDDAGEYAYW